LEEVARFMVGTPHMEIAEPSVQQGSLKPAPEQYAAPVDILVLMKV